MTQTATEVARAALAAVPLVDGHNDVPWQLRQRFGNDLAGFDFRDTTTLSPPMHVDLQRLRSGAVGAQCCAAYVPIEHAGPGAAAIMFEQLDVAKRLIDAYPDDLLHVQTAAEIERAHGTGRIATLLAVEGGHGIEDSLEHLRAAYAAGARYLTLVHNVHTNWADCCRIDPVHDGLTGFGREVVAEMNRLGMLVDLSHAAAKTMHDVLDCSRAPVACTHSGARAINDYPRNVDDALLERIAAAGGIVMATFVPYFVSHEVLVQRAAAEAEITRLDTLFPDEPARRAVWLARWRSANPEPRATLAQVADHIDHMRAVVGCEHIGIGSDFDGIEDVPEGLEDAGTFPALFAELARRGYTQAELEAIAGRNFLRVLAAVEALAE